MPIIGHLAIPPWGNQDLVVFHGTNSLHQASILAAVNVSLGRTRTDFGRGFYTTTDLPQARAWAGRISARVPSSSPAIVQLTLSRDELAKLKSVWFARANMSALDYWSLVTYCRAGAPSHARLIPPGWYDVAVGPLAASTQRRAYYRDSDQISFHTTAAEIVLNASPKVLIP